MERHEVLFRGMVQGVGFRYSARAIARNHNVAGYVRNLPDGRVEVVVEGEEDELDRYLARLRRQMADYISEVSVTRAEARGEFDAFEVRF